MKAFENLLPSEVKKAEKCANKALKTNNCKVTGYAHNSKPDEFGFLTVKCEICHDYEERAAVDVELNVFMPDRRRTWARAI